MKRENEEIMPLWFSIVETGGPNWALSFDGKRREKRKKIRENFFFKIELAACAEFVIRRSVGCGVLFSLVGCVEILDDFRPLESLNP